MRSLFYRHNPWQKLNLIMAIIALGFALFWHAVLNTIAQNQDPESIATLAQMLANLELASLFSSNIFWNAQFTGFFSIFTHATLWLSWLWLPVSIALIILIQGFAVLLNTPRWLRGALLITLAFAAVSGLSMLLDTHTSAQTLAIPAHVALYFSLAATWVSAARIRGYHSH